MAKGGGLSTLPEEAEALLRSYRPDDSVSSWSLQFSLDLENTIAILSGMSNMEQMQDNIKTSMANKRLSKEEKLALWRAMDIYRNSAPITPDMLKSFEGLTWNGVPTTAILQAYSICQIQPFPVTKYFLTHEMRRGSDAAGLERIRVHDLRHSHVSLLIDMGFSAVAIADRMGHESADITFRYAHLFPSAQSDMADQLDKARRAIG